jgi:hypothetical protein
MLHDFDYREIIAIDYKFIMKIMRTSPDQAVRLGTVETTTGASPPWPRISASLRRTSSSELTTNPSG